MDDLTQPKMQQSGLTCGNCGAAVAPEDVICPSCGALLAAYRAPAGSSNDTSSPLTIPESETSRPAATTSAATGSAPPPVASSIPVSSPGTPEPGNTPSPAVTASPRSTDPIGDALREAKRAGEPSPVDSARQEVVDTIDRQVRGRSSLADDVTAASASGVTFESATPSPATTPSNPVATGTPTAARERPKRPDLAPRPPVTPDPAPLPSINQEPDRPAGASGWRLGQVIPFVFIAVIILSRLSSSSARVGFPLVLFLAIFLLYGLLKSAQRTGRKTTDMPRDRRKR